MTKNFSTRRRPPRICQACRRQAHGMIQPYTHIHDCWLRGEMVRNHDSEGGGGVVQVKREATTAKDSVSPHKKRPKFIETGIKISRTGDEYNWILYAF